MAFLFCRVVIQTLVTDYISKSTNLDKDEQISQGANEQGEEIEGRPCRRRAELECAYPRAASCPGLHDSASQACLIGALIAAPIKNDKVQEFPGIKKSEAAVCTSRTSFYGDDFSSRPGR